MGDYVGDATQYAKWHVSRFREVFVRSLAQLGVKPLYRFWRVISQNACFRDLCILSGG